MRRPRSVVAALAGCAALLAALSSSLPSEALTARPRAADGPREQAEENRPKPFGAQCRTTVQGTRVVAYCHNPYPETDWLTLHVECARWWDIDSDGARVAVGPAMTVRLDGRCWKEVGAAWVSHSR
ncbi:hypothetical protein [Streptomyces sp. NPDC002851]